MLRSVALQVFGTVAAFLVVEQILKSRQSAARPAMPVNDAMRQAQAGLPPGNWRVVNTDRPWLMA